ncbi:MAG: helix-turn-helix domain-containing protein [Pseudomonadota bacterium]
MLPKHRPDFEFLLFDGFSNMVLANALEPLRDVKRNARAAAGNPPSWRVSTLSGEPAVSSSELTIAPDGRFDVNDVGENLVLVAGYNIRKMDQSALRPVLRSAIRKVASVLALDSSAWLLASAGVLDGHDATIHWQELDDFKEAFPRVRVSRKRFVESKPYITSGSAAATLSMMLELIQKKYGAAAAFSASTMFAYDPANQHRANESTAGAEERGSPLLLDAMDIMASHVETPLSVSELARKVSTSKRTLNRVFERELGMTPGRYQKMFRLQRARYLVQDTELGVEQIALRCGFPSASSFCRAFRSEFETTVTRLRRQLG